LTLHQPSLPQTVQTPVAERTKVISNPTRLPINRQAALAIRQKRCWIEDPPPEKPRVVSIEEHAEVQAQLKIERNNLAVLRDRLGVANSRIATLRLELEAKESKIARLQSQCEDLKLTVSQLEDIKL